MERETSEWISSQLHLEPAGRNAFRNAFRDELIHSGMHSGMHSSILHSFGVFSFPALHPSKWDGVYDILAPLCCPLINLLSFFFLSFLIFNIKITVLYILRWDAFLAFFLIMRKQRCVIYFN
jgi:hypothetical protein